MKPKVKEAIQAADGFIDLGMVEEAENELSGLPGIDLVEPAAVAVRLKIATRKGEWEKAEGYSYVLEQAVDKSHLPVCAGFHHAYARHLFRTGIVAKAKQHVASASRLWPDIRLAMLEDPGLAGIW